MSVKSRSVQGMEHVATKPSKASSNITEMVSKFAKVCKLRSIGVFSNEYPNHQHYHSNPKSVGWSAGEDGSDATEETECDGVRIHPQPAAVPGKSNVCGDKDVSEMLDIVSALKFAYVQLQEAHVPYDAEKIVAADEMVVSRLEALCNIKREYKEKQFKKAKLVASHLECVKAEIEVNERLLEKLKSQNRERDAEIVSLQQKLHDLDLGNKILLEKIKQNSLERKNARVLDVAMFEESFRNALKSIHDFAKPVISLMKAAGWDLDMAASAIENGVVYMKRSHKKYAFDAYIARRMFHGISLSSYNVDDVMRFDDPNDYLISNRSSGFANFCGKKYLFVVHPIMEMSFFGNLDQRMLVLSGMHPRTPFYQLFARMAKWVWILQGIATSIDPKAEMFTVNRGSKFSNAYMESVEEGQEGETAKGGLSNCKVEFMVMPGFKLGEKVVKSHNYELEC
ncbi:hypothetical protein Tsubulata_025754 [Turnera subulata]|uniref:DUF641 domain-containing protein n=1 Tax=Turnera subulata TaxID=218843 RepID=A0A9Q0JLC6_9ROSI|nr:hypothetical protein Tsubulata_025754 [Turnera subulata]